MSENKYIAVSQADFDQYGCPHCGYSTHNDKNGPLVPWMNTSDFWCSQCGKRSAILKENLSESTIGFGEMVKNPNYIEGDTESKEPKMIPGPSIFPKLEEHPLKNKI